MTYITEEEIDRIFVDSTYFSAINILRTRDGYIYKRRGNIIAPITTAYAEGAGQPKPKTYVIKSKNDIVKDILNDL